MVYPGVHRVYILGYMPLPGVYRVVYTGLYATLGMVGWVYRAICLPGYGRVCIPGYMSPYTPLGTPIMPGTLLVTVLHSRCAVRGVP